jgi:Nucleoside 2-deoxyribosyltransferase like
MKPAYVEPPGSYRGPYPAVFLAGGITDCPDWQQEARELLADWPGVILNPRRRDFPINDPDAATEQVAWEFDHLERADVVLFWFPPSSSPQPIALYELGRHAALDKLLAVGTDPEYLRRADVLLQLRHARPEIIVRSTLYEVCSEACLMVDAPT